MAGCGVCFQVSVSARCESTFHVFIFRCRHQTLPSPVLVAVFKGAAVSCLGCRVTIKPVVATWTRMTMITMIYGTLPPGGGRHIGGFTAHVLPTLNLKYRYLLGKCFCGDVSVQRVPQMRVYSQTKCVCRCAVSWYLALRGCVCV